MAGIRNLKQAKYTPLFNGKSSLSIGNNNGKYGNTFGNYQYFIKRMQTLSLIVMVFSMNFLSTHRISYLSVHCNVLDLSNQ